MCRLCLLRIHLAPWEPLAWASVCVCVDRRLCGVCVDGLCVKLVNLAHERGVWLQPRDVAAAVGGERVDQVLRGAIVCVDLLVNAGGCVAHRLVGKLDGALGCVGVTSMEGWSRSECAFAVRHCRRHGLWCDLQRKVLRRATKHNMFDVVSLEAGVRGAGTRGMSVCEMVVEYPGAYIDLHALLTRAGSELVRVDSQIWHRSTMALVLAPSLKRRRPISSGGTTRGVGVSRGRRSLSSRQ